VWQTIPDDRRSIAEYPTGERRPMATEAETILSVTRAVAVLHIYLQQICIHRAEAGQTGSLACQLSEL